MKRRTRSNSSTSVVLTKAYMKTVLISMTVNGVGVGPHQVPRLHLIISAAGISLGSTSSIREIHADIEHQSRAMRPSPLDPRSGFRRLALLTPTSSQGDMTTLRRGR